MNKRASFIIAEHPASFVEGQVAEGRYADASEVVQAGLRLLADEEAKLAGLRAAIIEGEESGDSELTFEEIWEEVKAEARRNAGHG